MNAKIVLSLRLMNVLPVLVLISAIALAGNVEHSDLGWLIGCWETPDQSAREVWVRDNDGSLVGFSAAIDDGKVGFYEVLRIKRDNQGTWTYTAHPSGQASATFVAIEIADNSVVFANPEHDYPQEIRYMKEGDALYASISLLNGENPRSFDYQVCTR